MIVAVVALAVQATSPSVLADADRRNAAFVTCLFATARAAHARAIPSGEFGGVLAGACLDEERLLRRLMISIMTSRGDRAPGPAADKTIREARAAVVTAYQR